MPCPRSLRVKPILAPAPGYFFSATWTLPPFALHSSALVSVRPWLWHPFWPLQALFALLHAPVPLHWLMPSHFTVSPAFFSALSFAIAAPEANSEATAVARMAFFIDMELLPEGRWTAALSTTWRAKRYTTASGRQKGSPSAFGGSASRLGRDRRRSHRLVPLGRGRSEGQLRQVRVQIGAEFLAGADELHADAAPLGHVGHVRVHAMRAALRQGDLELDHRPLRRQRLGAHERAAAADVADEAFELRTAALADDGLELGVEARVGSQAQLPPPEDLGQPLARQLVRVAELGAELLALCVGHEGAACDHPAHRKEELQLDGEAARGRPDRAHVHGVDADRGGAGVHHLARGDVADRDHEGLRFHQRRAGGRSQRQFGTVGLCPRHGAASPFVVHRIQARASAGPCIFAKLLNCRFRGETGAPWPAEEEGAPTLMGPDFQPRARSRASPNSPGGMPAPLWLPRLFCDPAGRCRQTLPLRAPSSSSTTRSRSAAPSRCSWRPPDTASSLRTAGGAPSRSSGSSPSTW